VLSARAVGPERYASLSVLWALVFLAAPGFFFPLEQEVGRALSDRRARGFGGAPLVRRAAMAGMTLVALLVAASLLGSSTLLDRLFDGHILLLVGFCLALTGYAITHLARGTLSGNGRFGPYGLLLGLEGSTRLVGCAVLFVAGVADVGPYGLLIGLTPFVALLLVLPRQRGLLRPGPEAPWSELSSALGFLLAGSVFAQLLVNAGPLAVKLLADESEQAVAGRFLAGLVIARVPLFLYQAVQAALLPKLAGLAASGRHADFRTGLARLVIVIIVIGVTATAGAFAVGPPVVRFLFGNAFDLARRDLGYLAAASAGIMLAQALGQALVALSGHARAAAAWFVAIITLVAVTAAGSDLLLRVELGLLAGAFAAAITMGALLLHRMRGGVTTSLGDLVDAVSPGREIIEP
jgi:O-antigen/teichoic acid export membrane protein